MSGLTLSPLQVARDGDGWRASAQVGGHRVDFHATHDLAPAAEAMPTAFLLPAMARGADLELTEPLCPEWQANIKTVRRLAREWWEYSAGAVRGPVGDPMAPRPDTALFFGGGVDSIFSLVTRAADIRHLVYVHGFDVPLEDRERLRRIDAWNREVAEAAGKQLITLRANLRQVPEFRLASWEITHGGALAAIAHLLAGQAGHFLLPSSHPPWVTIPWGSNAEMDPAWSSSRVRIESHGGDHDRLAKVRAIADSPLAHKYLRVCWRHQSAELNCGTCEKCVRTQLEFLAAGTLERVQTFPTGSLVERIDALPGIAKLIERNYLELVDHLGDSAVAGSVRALLARSPAWRRRQRWRSRLVGAARFLRWRFR